MDTLFLKLLNMSITASWLILAVVALRFLLKKAPRWISCALWALVALRLLLPIPFESALSLIPSIETVSPDIIYSQTPGITSGIPAINSAVNPIISGSFAPEVGASVNPLQTWTTIASYAWLVGIAAMLVYAAVSYLRLRKQVSASLNLWDNVWICDDIETPFILGVIRPRIYLPSRVEQAAQTHVIAHESAHLKRFDHLWKPLSFALLAVYWFNPLCWLAYILLSRDIELACDEKVISSMEKPDMIAYSEALFSCSVPRHMVMACPLAFGEVGVKERIRTVLNYKRPAFWIIIAAVVACVVVAVCFLTNPKEKAESPYAKRPTLVMDGVSYVNPYMSVSEPPYGYSLAGTLSEEQANDTKLAGCKYYANPNDTDSFFVFQQCGTPIDEKTVDSEKLQWAYVRWIKADLEKSFARLLTLDDVRFLAKKGDNLTWSDFDAYAYIETGSGLYIRVYEIDERFSLWIGGGPLDETPMYIRLVSEIKSDSYIDIRTENVEAFIAACGNADTPAQTIDFSSTYMYSCTVYINPFSSYYPVGTTGYLYKIVKNDSLNIIDEKTGEIVKVVSNVGLDWSPISLEEWQALFVIGDAPDISGIHEPLVMQLSDTYYLFNMDGSLWLGEYSSDKNGMWSVYELKLYWPKQTPAAVDVTPQTVAPLDAAVSAAILEHNRNGYKKGDFACESHVTLATVESEHKVTVYAMVLYQEYDLTSTGIKEVTGSHIPTALTFDVDEHGTHTLTEYWIPRDGSYYAPDIRDKFPVGIAQSALDTQNYILAQIQNCYAQAVEYGKVNTDYVLEQLLNVITSSPTPSSNPGDYIAAHPIEYRELTYYGDYTLKYVMSEFLKGGQTDLRGHIMRSVMDDLIGDEALKLQAATGQEYFDAWREHVEEIHEQNGDVYMKENCPKSWLLLQLIP